MLGFLPLHIPLPPSGSTLKKELKIWIYPDSEWMSPDST